MSNEELAKIDLFVNGRPAVQALDEVKKKIESLDAALKQAEKDKDAVLGDKLKGQLQQAKRDLRYIESGAASVNTVMKQLNKSTPDDLNRALKFLNREIKYIERGTPAWDEHVAKIKQVKGQLDKVNAELRASTSLMDRMKNTVNNWGASFAAGAASLTGLVMAGKKAVQTYAEMQQEEANVRKYTGMTAEEVEHLNEAFKHMDTRTSREGLNQLAQEAGRLGMQSEEDVLGFVRAADKINVALDELGEGATLTLSKLTDIFGDRERLGTEQSLLAVGSVINELSQNSTAAAPYLAEFAQRLAGVGAQANMTIPEIMGFGAVLDSQGQKLEMSATALSKVIMNLFKDPAKIAQATGLSIEEFSETCKRSTNEGLLMLLDRLHELGGIDALAPVFKDMGENGARASAVLAALAGNVDMVRQQQEAANVAFNEAISIDKEFDVQNNTVQAGLEKARKRFNELAVELGQKLMPVVRLFHSSLSYTMKALSLTIDFVVKYKKEILVGAAALAGYTVAVKAARIAEIAWNTVKKIGTALQLAWNAALMANPVGLVVGGLTAGVAALAVWIKKEKEAVVTENKLSKEEERRLKIEGMIMDLDKSITEEYGRQSAKVISLTKVIDNNNISLDKRREALNELKKIVPDYHATLTEEGSLLNNNKIALDNYLSSLKESIRVRMNQDKLEEIVTKQIPIEDKIASLKRQSKSLEDLDDNYREMLRTGEGYVPGAEDKLKKAIKENERVIKIWEHEIKKLQKEWDELEAAASKIGTVTSMKGVVSGIEDSTSTDAVVGDDRLKDLENWRKKEQAINDVAYANGKKTYSDYVAKNLEIEEKYHKDKLAILTKGSTEYEEEQARYAKKMRADNNAKSLKEQQEFYEEEKRCLDERYVNNELTHKQYTRALEEAELDYLNNMVRLNKEGSEEYIKAQEDLQKKEHEIQKKRFDEYKKIQDQLKSAYFSTSSSASDKEAYKEELIQLEVVKSQLELFASTEDEKYQIYCAYQEARYKIAEKYNMLGELATEEGINKFKVSMMEVASWLKSDAGQAFQKSFSTISQGMGEIFSNLSSLIDAQVNLQTIEIEKKYDKELELAEGNEAAVKDIEEKKQAEIAAIKNDAEEKKYGMQIADAVAQTAIAAINAYSSAAAIPIVGPFMAPIAAAMAIAAGGIQIATIKKQHEAAMAQGYASGGYTAPGGKYQPAGIVHAGEWVASQELLANPAAAATIAQLDQAQRTNTIGQLSKPAPALTLSKVDASTGQSTSLQRDDAPGMNVGESIDRLNKTLDGGIYAATLMTGDKGLVRAQKRYNQLMKNKGK